MTTRTLVLAWLALLARLALTVGSALIPLGTLNVAINFVIAAAKACIVAFVFMELARSTPAVRLAAVASVVWLASLGGLAVAALLARGG